MHDSRYQGLREPEVRGPAEFAEEPLDAIISGYSIFRKTAERFGYREDNGLMPLYQEACRLVEPYSSMKPDMGEVLHRLSGIAQENDFTGLYLSALLNVTQADELFLEDFPDVDHIGFHLPEGKRLFIGKNVKAKNAGNFARGGVYNWGYVKYMGGLRETGFQANWGEVDFFGPAANRGVSINFGECSNLGACYGGGASFNSGRVEHARYMGRLGTTINFSFYLLPSPVFPEIIEPGVVRLCPRDMRHRPLRRLHRKLAHPEFASLETELYRKLKEAYFLKKLKSPTPEALEAIRRFDSAKFASEILSITHKMEDYGRSHDVW